MPSSTPDGSRTTAADVLTILGVAEGAGTRLWIDGGWGVDALLGRQTHDHGDLDVAVEARHLTALLGALAEIGFTPLGEDGATTWNFLLAHPAGPILDLHVITIGANGDGVYGPAERGQVFPAASLTGRGTIGGRDVACISPEWVVAFHDQYVGDAPDRADVRAVCAAYGLEVPAQYR